MDKSGNGNALYGAYGSLVSFIPTQTLEPYVLWRQSNSVAAEQLQIAGGYAHLIPGEFLKNTTPGHCAYQEVNLPAKPQILTVIWTRWALSICCARLEGH